MSSPILRLVQQSDGRWIWTREEDYEAINLGWTGSTKHICGSLAARVKRPIIEEIAETIIRATGLQALVIGKEGVEA